MAEAGATAVRAAVDEFIQAFDNLEWERFRRCFAPDSTVFFPFDVNPRRADGKSEVEAGFKRFFERVTGVPGIGRRTLLLEREAGEWRIVHLHASNITAPAP